MSNLIDKYGTDWFRNKFRGSLFRLHGVPARVIGVGSRVEAYALVRRRGKVEARQTFLDYSHFPDSNMFAVPELGYRHNKSGKWLAYLSRVNTSYNRGISLKNLNKSVAQHTEFLRFSGFNVEAPDENTLCNMVMDPTFIPFRTGIKLMLEGKIISFAASPTIAVVPSDVDDSLIVRLCSKEIGTVSPEGELSLTLPFANKYLEQIV